MGQCVSHERGDIAQDKTSTTAERVSKWPILPAPNPTAGATSPVSITQTGGGGLGINLPRTRKQPPDGSPVKKLQRLVQQRSHKVPLAIVYAHENVEKPTQRPKALSPQQPRNDGEARADTLSAAAVKAAAVTSSPNAGSPDSQVGGGDEGGGKDAQVVEDSAVAVDFKRPSSLTRTELREFSVLARSSWASKLGRDEDENDSESEPAPDNRPRNVPDHGWMYSRPPSLTQPLVGRSGLGRQVDAAETAVDGPQQDGDEVEVVERYAVSQKTSYLSSPYQDSNINPGSAEGRPEEVQSALMKSGAAVAAVVAVAVAAAAAVAAARSSQAAGAASVASAASAPSSPQPSTGLSLVRLESEDSRDIAVGTRAAAEAAAGTGSGNDAEAGNGSGGRWASRLAADGTSPSAFKPPPPQLQLLRLSVPASDGLRLPAVEGDRRGSCYGNEISPSNATCLRYERMSTPGSTSRGALPLLQRGTVNRNRGIVEAAMTCSDGGGGGGGIGDEDGAVVRAARSMKLSAVERGQRSSKHARGAGAATSDRRSSGSGALARTRISDPLDVADMDAESCPLDCPLPGVAAGSCGGAVQHGQAHGGGGGKHDGKGGGAKKWTKSHAGRTLDALRLQATARRVTAEEAKPQQKTRLDYPPVPQPSLWRPPSPPRASHSPPRSPPPLGVSPRKKVQPAEPLPGNCAADPRVDPRGGAVAAAAAESRPRWETSNHPEQHRPLQHQHSLQIKQQDTQGVQNQRSGETRDRFVVNGGTVQGPVPTTHLAAFHIRKVVSERVLNSSSVAPSPLPAPAPTTASIAAFPGPAAPLAAPAPTTATATAPAATPTTVIANPALYMIDAPLQQTIPVQVLPSQVLYPLPSPPAGLVPVSQVQVLPQSAMWIYPQSQQQAAAPAVAPLLLLPHSQPASTLRPSVSMKQLSPSKEAGDADRPLTLGRQAQAYFHQISQREARGADNDREVPDRPQILYPPVNNTPKAAALTGKGVSGKALFTGVMPRPEIITPPPPPSLSPSQSMQQQRESRLRVPSTPVAGPGGEGGAGGVVGTTAGAAAAAEGNPMHRNLMVQVPYLLDVTPPGTVGEKSGPTSIAL